MMASSFDLQIFQAYFGLDAEGISIDVGGYLTPYPCDGSTCGEGNLDTQYLTGIAQNIPTTFWHNSNTSTFSFMSWVFWLEDNPYPPLVNSASVIARESYVSISEFETFNTEAMKLGLRGVTLVGGSGDWGVTGPNNTLAGCGYTPLFPSSCPYVVSVGGTQGIDEVACQGNMGALITTGGGFSSYYSQPSYQKASVTNYFSQTSPYNNPSLPGQSFNKSNRGYPDISALAAFYSVVYAEEMDLTVAGTSASTPVMSAMLSLINAARRMNGQSSLGFVQPLLYSQGNSFIKDIVSGNNSCLESETGIEAQCCPVQGFTAQTGWDPVTGLGSLRFSSFYDVAVTNSKSNNNDDDDGLTSGQQAAFGISIAVIIIMSILSILFVCQIPIPCLPKAKESKGPVEKSQGVDGMELPMHSVR